jgi:hypothetical protein
MRVWQFLARAQPTVFTFLATYNKGVGAAFAALRSLVFDKTGSVKWQTMFWIK